MTKIVVIGGGKIGEALISGLVNADVDPQSITVTGRRPERGEELRERYGVRDSTDNRQAAEDADVVFLVHRPDAYDKEDRPGEADIIMAKHRNGPTQTFNLAFLGAYSKFKDMPQDYQSQQEV